MIKRCDDKFDCQDKSDEKYCQKVVLDAENYNNAIPPYISGSNVGINVSIYLSSVDHIILPSTFEIKFLLELTWKDYRIQFQNLQNVNIINDKESQSIWIPPLVFTNSKDNGILANDEKTIISILKMSEPKFNNYKELRNAAIFEGRDTLIKYTREYQMKMICNYELQFYPFDHQICTIDVEIPTLLQDYIDIYPQNTNNLGVSKLNQFLITKTEIQSSKNYSLVQCRIFLHRIPWYHIATTYMPIVLVLFLALITLWIDQSHFDAIIMVSLTCMLVMYTLFQSIAANMPTTAYLKLLDYFLIFAMIMPFVVFCILTTWKLLDDFDERKFLTPATQGKLTDENDKNKSLAISTEGQFVQIHNQRIKVKGYNQNFPDKPKSDENTHKKRASDDSILQHAKWFLPLLTLAYIIFYTLVVIYVYL